MYIFKKKSMANILYTSEGSGGWVKRSGNLNSHSKDRKYLIIKIQQGLSRVQILTCSHGGIKKQENQQTMGTLS